MTTLRAHAAATVRLKHCGNGNVDVTAMDVVGGFMVAYCVLAFVSFIVCASGADGAIRHNCEGTVACASATPWYGDADCGHDEQ